MGWEERSGRLYYYRKQRSGQAVVSEYFGTGSAADLIATMDGMEREERRSERTRWTEQQASQTELDDQATAFDSTVRTVLCAALLTDGFRPHKGQWRKMRNAE